MVPPMILFSQTNPCPGAGSTRIRTSPYCPCPPLWRTNRPRASAVAVIVSLKATCGRPTRACTPNSRFMRSTRISRCSSPIPEIRVCPVSSWVRTRKVGSSSDSLSRLMASLSSSALLLGSIETWMTGSGNWIRSSRIGMLLVAKRVAGRDLPQPDQGADARPRRCRRSPPAGSRASRTCARSARARRGSRSGPEVPVSTRPE